MRYTKDMRESRKLDENQRGGINKACTRRREGKEGGGEGALTQLPHIIATDRKRKVLRNSRSPWPPSAARTSPNTTVSIHLSQAIICLIRLHY